MTTAGELSVSLKGQDVGLSALLQKIDAQAQKSADSALRLSQQYANLARAQGQPVLSAQILSGAMGSVAGASESATVAVQTQLSRLASGTPIAQQFGSAVSSSLLSIAGPAAIAATAIGGVTDVIRSFGEAFAFKAQLDASTASINTLLHGVRDTGEVWAGAARFANEYKLTQQETNEAIQASVRIIRSSKAPIEDILGAFARLKVLSPEKSFSDASRALSELQAGQVVSIEHLFNVPRADANAMKKEIEGGADAVQVLNSYLDRTGVSMDAVKAQTTGAMGAMKELAQAQEQLKIAQAEFAQGPGLVILQGQIQTTVGLTRLLSGDSQAMGQSIANAANQGSFGFQFFNQVLGGVPAKVAALTNAQNAQTAATQQGAAATQQADAATTQLGGAMDAERQAVAAASAEHDKQTQALAEQIIKKQASQQAGQQLAQVETILANLGGLVASGQITAGEGALRFAQMTGIAIEKARELIGLQAQLANVTAPATAGTLRAAGSLGAYAGEIDRIKASNASSAKTAKDYQDAQLALARAHKNTAGEVAILRDRQKYLNKSSAEYVALEAQIVSVEESGAKKKKGGGVKLTDQQKLNNSLISDQEKYEEKYDDLEAQHEQKRLNILLDYQDKVQKAQRDFAQEQLDSRASFYDSLGGIEGKNAGKIQKAASEAYEQAAVEAGKIAQEKGADVADKYMHAQEQVISARAKRQAEIEKAAKEGEKGRAEYLKGVDAQYRAAEDAKIADIKEGGGSLAAERDKQLADENRAYEEQSGKLADHAEASADRRIAAAQRAGKAIDDEAAKAAALGDVYNKIAPNAPTAATPAPNAPTAATPAPTQPAPVIAGAAPTDATVSAIGSAKDAIVAALAAVERAAKETTGAVRNIKATGGVAG